MGHAYPMFRLSFVGTHIIYYLLFRRYAPLGAWAGAALVTVRGIGCTVLSDLAQIILVYEENPEESNTVLIGQSQNRVQD